MYFTMSCNYLGITIMDTGNFRLSYEEYVEICHSIGIYREWEIELGWKNYLIQIKDNSLETLKKTLINLTVNMQMFYDGRFN